MGGSQGPGTDRSVSRGQARGVGDMGGRRKTRHNNRWHGTGRTGQWRSASQVRKAYVDPVDELSYWPAAMALLIGVEEAAASDYVRQARVCRSHPKGRVYSRKRIAGAEGGRTFISTWQICTGRHASSIRLVWAGLARHGKLRMHQNSGPLRRLPGSAVLRLPIRLTGG